MVTSTTGGKRGTDSTGALPGPNEPGWYPPAMMRGGGVNSFPTYNKIPKEGREGLGGGGGKGGKWGPVLWQERGSGFFLRTQPRGPKEAQ